ncbi:MAG: class I SAM-dependent methyltransferase [Gammaproteobacteria bacterium]|nr:class I SAM-dependent methyltransferase [Gammaproteobacteria bacterium]
MRRSADEIALIERFDRSYQRGQTDTMRAIERAVCGCDYGGTSWTTREEAELLSELLALGPGAALLDVGAGSGWPALYMAAVSGCDATLADLPLEGIRIASKRYSADQPAGRCGFAVADGSALPFREASFDAICHSDVLCCLPAKGAVLRECRRVIRPGGKMAFSVIYIADGISSARGAAAIALGPPYIEAECGYPEMLAMHGWEATGRIDLSSEFAQSTERLVNEWTKNESRVKTLVGEQDFSEYLTRKINTLPLIHDGTIRRDLFSATPSP